MNPIIKVKIKQSQISDCLKLTPGIHAGITSWVRASLAGICARPKAHPKHVLFP